MRASRPLTGASPELDAIARELGGYADGFGSFGNAELNGRRN